jgi:integrase
MAGLQERGGSFRILFRHHGKQHTFTLGAVSREEAEAKARQADYLLMRLRQGLLVLPEGTDIVTFIEHDGKPPAAGPTLPAAPRQAVTLSHLKDRYLETHRNNTIEPNSLDTCELHLGHVCRVLGGGLPLGGLTLERLQEYVNNRAGKGISPVTVRKELGTLRAAWNWGAPMELTSGPFPSRGLRYPRAREKPPFMTWAEVMQNVVAHPERDPGEFWECLYLTLPEVTDLLAFVRGAARQPWVYPMLCFAAHTGARRSEMLRALVADVDFEGNTVLVREKKRAKGKDTTRRVPLTPGLKEVLRGWLAEHPGGPYLFCHGPEVARSKKRSRTTGHKGQGKRATTLKGRVAGVSVRLERPGPAPLTRDEAQDLLKRTLAGSKWEVLRGFHVLRHSFISACANKGVDQRLIDEWVGHSTEEQRKRYRHLWPSTQRQAILTVFGQKLGPGGRKRRGEV